MKLVNKKTGEIGYLYANKNENYNVLDENDKVLAVYGTLEAVVGEWQDYEEPKEYWYIEGEGDIHSIRTELCDELEIHTMKQIGNYFETKEDAELAVRKLKAWRRLKDKGFRITLRGCKGNAWLYANWGNLQGDYSDVLLLFGGEE